MQNKFKVIDSDNYDGDYPDQKELCWVAHDGTISMFPMSKEHAQEMADLINKIQRNGNGSPRFMIPVPLMHKLSGPFEP